MFARIQAVGSNVASANDLTLTTFDLPMNQFGYYLCSQTQGLIMTPGGSMGNLCLGGSIGRFAWLAQNSGPSGEISTVIDLTSMPTNPSTPVMAGQSWNFQLWYRDFFFSTTSNFSEAIEVLYQ